MKQLQSIKAISRIMALTGLSPVRTAESTLMIKDLSVNKELDCQTLSAVSGGLDAADFGIESYLYADELVGAAMTGKSVMAAYVKKMYGIG